LVNIFKKTITRPLPANAELFDHEVTGFKVRFASWRDRAGKTQNAQTTVSKGGTIRIRLKTSTRTAKYRDGEGVVREVMTGCFNLQDARSKLAESTRTAELARIQPLMTRGDKHDGNAL